MEHPLKNQNSLNPTLFEGGVSVSKIYLWPVLLFLSLCLFHFSDYFVGLFHDDAYYFLTAKSLLNGHYADLAVPGEPALTAYYPGYPAIIAAWSLFAGHNIFSAKLLSLILSFCSFLLALKLAARDLNDRRLYFFAVFMALHPFTSNYAGAVMSEPAFLVLSLLALSAFSKEKEYLFAFLTAACFLVRPAGLNLLAAGVVSLAASRRPASAIKVLLIFSTAVIPWLIRNYFAQLDTGGSAAFASFHFSQQWVDDLRATANPLPAISTVVSDNIVFYGKMIPFFVFLPFGFLSAGSGFSAILAPLFLLISCVFALILVIRARMNDINALYVFFYLIFHIFWINQDQRYLYPLTPILFIILLSHWDVFQTKLKSTQRLNRLTPWLIAAGIGFFSIGACLGQLRYQIPKKFGGKVKPSFLFPAESFAWIRANLPPSAVIGSTAKARIFLYTERKGCELPRTPHPDAYCHTLLESGANYLFFRGTEADIATAGMVGQAERRQRSLRRKFLMQRSRYRLRYRNDREKTFIFEIAADRKKFSEALHLLKSGYAAWRQKKHDSAQKYFRQALRDDPSLMSGYDALVLMLAENGKYSQAIAAAKDAIRAFPIHTPAHWRLGQLYRMTGEKQMAHQEFEIALNLAKRDQDPEMEKFCLAALKP
ncbi:MAG: tetratricopeptide repeat protein [Elusimicrobia bacterium]|nr:tetratricopeptide repeat protein [Elusimicrobiota bacterium]